MRAASGILKFKQWVFGINGHTGCAAAERYLERDGRAIGHDFINLDCLERDDGSTMGWGPRWTTPGRFTATASRTAANPP